MPVAALEGGSEGSAMAVINQLRRRGHVEGDSVNVSICRCRLFCLSGQVVVRVEVQSCSVATDELSLACAAGISRSAGAPQLLSATTRAIEEQTKLIETDGSQWAFVRENVVDVRSSVSINR